MAPSWTATSAIGTCTNGLPDSMDRARASVRATSQTALGVSLPHVALLAGLYSAQQSRSPDPTLDGMHRAHHVYYLVCKAGGGIAAQTFHARLASALGKGTSLDDCLKTGSNPGPQALRRVGTAGQRNRARILLVAAECLGLDAHVDTVSDSASSLSKAHRMAVVHLNAHTNALRELEVAAVRPSWYYSAGCIDSAISQGLIAPSNPQEGFVVCTDANGGLKVSLRNPAYNFLPFSSVRIASNRDAVMRAAEAHKAALATGSTAHPDGSWLRERFAWKSTQRSKTDLEPPCLWGAYASEAFVTVRNAARKHARRPPDAPFWRFLATRLAGVRPRGRNCGLPNHAPATRDRRHCRNGACQAPRRREVYQGRRLARVASAPFMGTPRRR